LTLILDSKINLTMPENLKLRISYKGSPSNFTTKKN